jgi:hypothetical protein
MRKDRRSCYLGWAGEHMTKTETVLTDIYDAWRSQDLDRVATYLPIPVTSSTSRLKYIL